MDCCGHKGKPKQLAQNACVQMVLQPCNWTRMARKGLIIALPITRQGGTMKLWHRMRCRTNSHSPVPHRVGWDGKHYRGTCRHCGVAIVRLENGKWRDFNSSIPIVGPNGFSPAFERSGRSRKRVYKSHDGESRGRSPHAQYRPRKIRFEETGEDPPWEPPHPSFGHHSADRSDDTRP